VSRSTPARCWACHRRSTRARPLRRGQRDPRGTRPPVVSPARPRRERRPRRSDRAPSCPIDRTRTSPSVALAVGRITTVPSPFAPASTRDSTSCVHDSNSPEPSSRKVRVTVRERTARLQSSASGVSGREMTCAGTVMRPSR
jgi:hypothetical protein